MTAQQPLFRPTWHWRGLRGPSYARFSPCPEHGPDCECPQATYRYELRRTWDASKRPLVVIACNPSVAGSLRDDNTCRLLYGRANRMGLGGVRLFNAFALRSTDPKALVAAVKAGCSPIGPESDDLIAAALEEHRGDRLPLAWGGDATLLDRGRAVADMAYRIHGHPECLGVTATGEPRHPLRIPTAMEMLPLRTAREIQRAEVTASTHNFNTRVENADRSNPNPSRGDQ